MNSFWFRESRSRACAALALVALASTAGCSEGLPARVPVSGVVLIDGKPLTRGSIMVIPAGERAAGGDIGADGRFSLTTYQLNDGVVPGTHRVAIQSNEHIGERDTRWLAPKKYKDPAASGLTVTIDKPINDLTINITWDGKKPFVERM